MDQTELEAIEKERLDELQALKDYPPPGDWRPGSQNCYAVIDRVHRLSEAITEWVLEHPSVKLNAEWYRKAYLAQQLLFCLYDEMEIDHTVAAPNETDTFET